MGEGMEDHDSEETPEGHGADPAWLFYFLFFEDVAFGQFEPNLRAINCVSFGRYTLAFGLIIIVLDDQSSNSTFFLFCKCVLCLAKYLEKLSIVSLEDNSGYSFCVG